MLSSLIFNLAVAAVWILLKGEANLVNLVWGYILGAFILWFFRKVPPGKVHPNRIVGFLGLAFVFVIELIKANLQVLRIVLSANPRPRSGIVAFPLEVQSDWGITVLANLITLTPGTISVEVTPDRKTLYIHTLDIDDPQSVVEGIKSSFEKRVAEVFE